MLGGVAWLGPWWLDVEVAQQRSGGAPGLPSAAPHLGERAGVAEDLADLCLALRDTQVGQFLGQLGGRQIASRAAGERVKAGTPEGRRWRKVGSQRCPTGGLRRGTGELVLDFLVGDRRAERTVQDGLGVRGDSLPGAGGGGDVPPADGRPAPDETPQ